MTLMFAWSLRAAATIAFGLLVVVVLRRRSAATRNFVLRATLTMAWLVPLIAFVVPRVEIRTPEFGVPAAIPITRSRPTGGTLKPVAERWSIQAGLPGGPGTDWTYGLVRTTPSSSVFVALPGLLLASWALGAGLLILRWVSGFTKLLRCRRSALPTDEPDVWRAAVPVPATYGHTILLPLASDTWPATRRRASIFHERAHVARRDWLWQAFATLFAALHWPNPFVWLFLRTLRDSAESAADDQVLTEMKPVDYARELLAVAIHATPDGPALAMARRGGVKDRVVAVLSDRDRRVPTRPLAWLLVVGLGSAGLLATAIAPAEATAVAVGETQKASGPVIARLSEGGEVRLLTIRDPIGAPEAGWAPGGGRPPREPRTLPNFSRGGAPLRPDERQLRLCFTTTVPVIEPSQFTVLPRSGDMRPVGWSFQGLPGGGAAVWADVAVPTSLGRIDLEVQLPAGPWRREKARIEFAPSENRSAALRNVEARVARPEPNRWYHLVAIDARGRTVREAIDPGFGEGRVTGAFSASVPLERIRVESRPIAKASFAGVRLRPDTPAVAASLAKARTVELAGVWSPDVPTAPWHPDGSKGGPAQMGSYDGTIPLGSRAMLFAFRLRGKVTAAPTIRVRPAIPGARFEDSKLSLVLDEGNVDGAAKLVWIRTIVPKAIETCDLDVELGLDPPEPGEPLPKGKVSVERTSVDVRPGASYAQLRVIPHVPLDPARFWYSVSPVDARGGSLEAFGYEDDGPIFRISMAHPERAAAWRVWRSPRERTRVAGVRLRPDS